MIGELMAGDSQRIVLAAKYNNATPGQRANSAGNEASNIELGFPHEPYSKELVHGFACEGFYHLIERGNGRG